MKKRIVWVEDGGLRDLLAPRFENGFKREDVEFEARKDFTKLKEEVASENLADVYILDNEITGDSSEGAQMAQQIHDRANTSGKEVLVITMLCSNPTTVREKYGSELDTRGIPTLHKNNQVAICGFYVGACLEEQRKTKKKLGFGDWLRQEGINLPNELTHDSQSVDGAISLEVKYAQPGGFYLSPRDFIQQHRPKLEEGLMKPSAIAEMDRIFPVSQGLEIVK